MNWFIGKRKIKIQITDQAGGKMVTAELPLGVPISKLLPIIVNMMALPTNVSWTIIHKETGKVLMPDESLSLELINPGDFLRILPNVSAGGGIPVRSFGEVHLVVGWLRQRGLANYMNGKALFALFLYTEEDSAIATYMQGHTIDLHHLTGSDCLFFVLEEPNAKWKKAIQQFLRNEAGAESADLLDQLGLDSFRPYDRNKAYEIARQMNISYHQLPCVVFFNNLNDRTALVVEINHFVDSSKGSDSEFAAFFRMLFDQVRKTSKLREASERFKVLSRGLVKERWKFWKYPKLVPLASPLIDIILNVFKFIAK